MSYFKISKQNQKWYKVRNVENGSDILEDYLYTIFKLE